MTSPNSDAFLLEGAAMSERLGLSWPQLLLVMNLESGLRPDAGLGTPGHAIGVIQLMPSNLRGVGWDGTREEFGRLSDADQLPFVERFLRGPASHGLHSSGRIHQALFVPATLTRPDLFPDDPDTVIAARDRSLLPGSPFDGALVDAYHFNQGFDPQHRGVITTGMMTDVDVAAGSNPTSRLQADLLRLESLRPDLLERGNAGVGGVPWMAVGVLVALGVGGAMLLEQSGNLRLPTWTPRWMRAA